MLSAEPSKKEDDQKNSHPLQKVVLQFQLFLSAFFAYEVGCTETGQQHDAAA